jgi:hypothetical protein
MRLFILATPPEHLFTTLVTDRVMDIIQAGAEYPSTSFYIIADQFNPVFIDFCKSFKTVHLLTLTEAKLLLKTTSQESFIHFGASIKGAEKQHQYFIPLTTPGAITPLSIIAKYLQEKQFLKFIKTAKQVLFINEWIQEQVENKFPITASIGKLTWLPTYTNPIYEWHQLAATKESLADGYPYFLACIPITHFVDTLKEFSVFKKWQQSTMRLVFIFDEPKEYDKAAELLKGYKYKENISLKRSKNLKRDWLAAAYFILWQGVECSKTFWIESAVHYDIPMLFDEQIKMPVSWQKAGEVFSFSEKGALSNHFKLYYKDEVYRHAKARTGKAWIELINAERETNGLFQLPADLA